MNGTVWVTVGTEDDHAVLSVADTGPVIAPGEVNRLLLPFQRGGTPRTRRARPGSGPDDGFTNGLTEGPAGVPAGAPAGGQGLGLPITSAIAAAHGAAFTIAARPEDGGLAAKLAFPSAHPAWYAPEAPIIDQCPVSTS